jgi:hypothetical protein
MIRVASLAIVLVAFVPACSNDKASGAPSSPPAAAPGPAAAQPSAGATATGGGSGSAFVDDPKFHLKPDEGTLEVGKAEGKAGSETVAAIKLTPSTGYHISTDFPIKLTLETPDGVKLAKTELTAGKGEKGDADAFSEQALAFAVKATADKAGSYEVKGVFKFGVCDKESCHPKKQPITIQVAAN